MKLTCPYRRKDALLYAATLITAFIGMTSFAQSFDTGTATNIASDTTYNETMYVGFLVPNNTVLIESNSTVSATKVVVGHLSTNNTLTVEDGSLLVAGDATTGGLTNGGVVVGSADGDAALRINNSSALNTEYLYVGFGTNDSGAIELSGDGTELNVAQDAFVGYAGSTNSIEISDGATLNMGGTLTVGSATSSDNHVTVASGGSLFVNETNNIDVINADGDNDILIRSGGTLQIGGDVQTGTLDDLGVNLSTHANLELGGSLVLANNEIDDRINIIVNGTLSTNTASWTSASITTIGDNTSDNSLIFTNGATGHAINNLQLGGSSTSTGNELAVGGTGTVFTTDANVIVGAFGRQNELNVSDGGRVDIAETLYLGAGDANATGNKVNIKSNGTLNVTGDVIVGHNSNNNKFNVEGSMVDVGGNFIMGNTAEADGITYNDTANIATVGTNATMDIHQDLTVGMDGNGNIFNIRDGGVVTVDGDAVIGKRSDDNYIFLMPDNTNNLLNVAGDLVIGVDGEDNRFSIYGGTANIAGNVSLGASTNQHVKINYIHLQTTNAVLNVANAVNIGASNSENVARIVAGATINTHDLFVGTYGGVSNNTVTISGEEYNGLSGTWLNYVADSLVYVTNRLEIGNTNGANNSLIVRDGGILNVGQTNITIYGEDNILNIADGGTLQTIDWDATIIEENIIMDSGSTLELGGSYLGTDRLDNPYALVLNGALSTNTAQWNTGSDILYVGFLEDGNTLTAKDGGMIATDTNLIVGLNDKTTGNELKSIGTNSLIDVGNNVTIGRNGSSNNGLTIEEGGQVDVGNNLIIGSASGNNSGLISGLSNSVSTLNIANKLTIGTGADANGNTLTISSNAAVTVGGIATIGANANNNTLEITETNAFFHALTNFVIGTGTAADNEFTIREGTAIVEGDLIIGKDLDSTGNSGSISGSNSTLQVLSDLYVGKDGSRNTLAISDGGTVEAANAYIGFTTNSHDNAVTVAGTNSSLTVNGTLYAGYEGNNNSMAISDGATLTVSNAYIGYASERNFIDLSGSNTLFSVLNNLYVGNDDINLLDGSAFTLDEGATATVGGNLAVSGSFFSIGAGSQVMVDGNYSQDEFSVLALGVSTNSATTNLVVGNTASFAKNTTFELNDDNTIVGTTNNVIRALVAAGALQIDEQVATQDLLNDYITIGNDLLDFNLILSNNIIWIDNVTRLSLATASGLNPGSQLFKIADEIDIMADGSNEVAVVMRDFMDTKLDSEDRNTAFQNYYGEKMSSTPAHNAINMGMQSVADQLTKRADSTRARMGMASANGPAGAGGPHMTDQPMQGWITGYKTWADKSSASGFDGYDGNIGGFLVGADLSVAEGLLVGIAGGAGNATLDKDNGASTDTDTTFGSIYVSAGTKDWFADASLIYGGSSVDTVLGSTFDTTASYDAQNTAIYVGGGKEITGNYLIITPQASLLGNYYKQDSYVEKSSDAVVREVDSFDTLYLQSSIGCNVGFYTAMGDLTLKPELRAFWVHEFNAKEEDVSFQLVDGTGSYNMQLQAPESDIIKLGAGLSAKIGEYLELRADLDTRRGSDYSDHTLLGSIRYQF